MTLYELIKSNSGGKGEEAMWKSIETVSKAVEHSMPEDQKNALLREVYGVMSGKHYNEEIANEDIKKLYYVDRAGNKHSAPYWPAEDVKEIYESVKGDIKPYNACDFMVAMNLMASDYWPLLERWYPGISQEDRDERTIDLAVNFLNDPDAKSPETKVWDFIKK